MKQVTRHPTYADENTGVPDNPGDILCYQRDYPRFE